MTRWKFWLVLVLVSGLAWGRGYRDRLEGLVYEAEDWSTPKDGWQLNVHGRKNWCLWTEEPDVWNKRSGGQSLKTPMVEKDRATSEEGAPVLHTRITGIPKGSYQVFMNNTIRLLGISLDGGKTWRPSRLGAEEYLGYHIIDDGVFEVWVDDRYASTTTRGSAYFDYIRLVPAPPLRIYDCQAFTLPNGATQISWITSLPLSGCQVEVRCDGGQWQQAIEPNQALRNHALELTGLQRGKRYEARVSTTINGKNRVTGETFAFIAGAELRPAKTAELSVPLTVHEPTDKGRRQWPVTSGIPFRAGALREASDAILVSAEGQTVPTLFEVMSRWPDGSVKWLIAHFKADTKAGQDTRYTLKTGPGLGMKNPGFVESPDILASVLDYFDAELTLGDGRVLRMDKSKLERRGLAAKNFGVAGEFAGDFVAEDGQRLFRWRLELGAMLGTCSDVRVRFSVGNNVFSSLSVPVKSLALTQANPHVAIVGRDHAETTSWRLSDGTALPAGGGLFQYLEKESELKTAGRTVKRGRGDGFLVSSDGTCQVSLRSFWQLYPKGLEVAEDGSLCWWLLPELPQQNYPPGGPRNLKDDCLHWFWLRDGCYVFRQGVEITNELSVRLDRSAGGSSALWHDASLFAQTSTSYACGTGAFGAVLPQLKGYFPEYEKNFARSFSQLEEGRRRRGEYGWMNFGDWYGERRWNWGNNEYDMSYVTAVQFARTGRLDVLWRGDEMARHYQSIDVINYADPKHEPREYIYEHCIGHVGGFLDRGDPRIAKEQKFLGFCAPLHDSGHAHVPGLFFYACLRGDWRTLRAAERCAWSQAEKYTRNFNFAIERAAGWPLINATYAYLFTGNPYYLNAAKIYFEKIKTVQNPQTGCFDLRQDQSECDCPDKAQHRGGKAFATGVLMHGLARLWEVTGDPEVKTCLVRCADWLLDYAWNEAKQGFRYKTGCPKYANSGWYSTIVTEGIAYAGELTGNRKYLDFLIRTIGSHLRSSTGSGWGSGKEFSQFHRHLPHTLYYLAKHGVTRTYDLRNPLVGLRTIVVDPRGIGRFAPVLRNSNELPLHYALRLWCPDKSVQVEGGKAELDVAGNSSAHCPAMGLKLSGQTGQVAYELTIGKQVYSGRLSVVRRPRAAVPGKKVGFVGSPQSFTLKALERHGFKGELLGHLDEASLDGFGAVVIGGDAFAKGQGAPSAPTELGVLRLEDFASAGGLVVCFQMNDTDWRCGHLGAELVIEEPDSRAGAIVDGAHWLLQGVKDLSGNICYDRIQRVSKRWRVLVRDSGNRPCVLSLPWGKGEVVVVQPNVDRVYSEPDIIHHRESCVRLLENIVSRCQK